MIEQQPQNEAQSEFNLKNGLILGAATFMGGMAVLGAMDAIQQPQIDSMRKLLGYAEISGLFTSIVGLVGTQIPDRFLDRFNPDRVLKSFSSRNVMCLGLTFLVAEQAPSIMNSIMTGPQITDTHVQTTLYFISSFGGASLLEYGRASFFRGIGA